LVAVALPFVTDVWQIYLLIFALQSASAAFTPTFQATIPDILPEERDYTNALSLSRLAYDLENLLSPTIAALLLFFVSYESLFSGTVLGFSASALLVLSVALPSPTASRPLPFLQRTRKGARIYFATPRLRGLLAISLAVASAGAMVIVNTVVIVQGRYGLSERATAVALAALGAGSMVAALGLPSLLARFSDRTTLLVAVLVLVAGLAIGAQVSSFEILVSLWFVLGLGYSAAQTPAGRLLKRSSHSSDRPALFAAHFALSHACWLLAYPLAGWLAANVGVESTFLAMCGVAVGGLVAALVFWPADEHELVSHLHPDLPDSDPHWREAAPSRPGRHAHVFVIDELHPRWPW
jgi:predicted MFS family arabinose efflux permease